MIEITRETPVKAGIKPVDCSSMCPALESVSIRPRQTMSFSAPLGCRQPHASHNFADSLRRLKFG